MSDDNTTPLQCWLNLHGLKYNHLAIQLDMSPHTVRKFASGEPSTVINKVVLQKISLHTGLTYQELIDPVSQSRSRAETGDKRIDVALATIARYLHSDVMAIKCRKYFALDFRCIAHAHASNEHTQPVNYDEMCALNAIRSSQINSTLLSVAWYDADCNALDAHILHTYWRASVIGSHGMRYEDTFLVLGFVKSINEMTPFDLPQIKTFWWDSPTEIQASEHRTDLTDYKSAIKWPVKIGGGGVNMRAGNCRDNNTLTVDFW